MSYFLADLVNKISYNRKVKRNLGTSNKWPHIVPKTCFKVTLEDVLTTPWGRPESTSWGLPLDVRLGITLDIMLGRPQDVRLWRPHDGQIRSLEEVLETLQGTSSESPRDQSLLAGIWENYAARFYKQALF